MQSLAEAANLEHHRLESKMINAMHSMIYWQSPYQSRQIKINSRTFQKLKEEFSKVISTRFLGIPKTDEHKLKISNSNKKNNRDLSGSKNPMYGKNHSEKVRIASSERLSKTNSLRRWYNNGTQNQFSILCPGADWQLGRIMKPTSNGYHWYNNGIIQTTAKNQPIGWNKGPLPKK